LVESEKRPTTKDDDDEGAKQIPDLVH
jgi:hypothetical protein